METNAELFATIDLTPAEYLSHEYFARLSVMLSPDAAQRAYAALKEPRRFWLASYTDHLLGAA